MSVSLQKPKQQKQNQTTLAHLTGAEKATPLEGIKTTLFTVVLRWGSHYVFKADLEVGILLPQLLDYLGVPYVSPHLRSICRG